MTGSFRVDPDGIERVALTLRGYADDFASALSVFAAAARLPGGAFGILPQSGEASSQYQGLLDDALDKLQKLHETVALTATGLSKTAAPTSTRRCPEAEDMGLGSIVNPGGDPGAIRAAAGAWRDMAGALSRLQDDVTLTCNSLAPVWDGRAYSSFQGFAGKLVGDIRNGVDGCNKVAATLDQVAGKIEEVNSKIHHIEAEAAATGVIAIGLSVVTLGGSDVVGAGVEAAEAGRAAALVAEMAAAITEAMEALRAIRGGMLMFRFAVQFAAGLGGKVFADVATGRNPSFNLTDLRNIAVASTIGAGIGGLPGASVRIGSSELNLFSSLERSRPFVNALLLGGTGGALASGTIAGLDGHGPTGTAFWETVGAGAAFGAAGGVVAYGTASVIRSAYPEVFSGRGGGIPVPTRFGQAAASVPRSLPAGAIPPDARAVVIQGPRGLALVRLEPGPSGRLSVGVPRALPADVTQGRTVVAGDRGVLVALERGPAITLPDGREVQVYSPDAAGWHRTKSGVLVSPQTAHVLARRPLPGAIGDFYSGTSVGGATGSLWDNRLPWSAPPGPGDPSHAFSGGTGWQPHLRPFPPQDGPSDRVVTPETASR